MVVVEGLSVYHSRFFSGLRDLTPNLDRIASGHMSFDRFWANGFTTENGLIALLGGELPIPGAGQVVFGGGFAFDGFSPLPGSLPGIFAAHGYHTAFLTPGDLSFSGKGAWLRQLGFQEIRGHDDPFYDGWPRLHFKAAPDSALFLRAQNWLEDRDSRGPFLLVLETVSSHSPFIEPVTRERSEDAVFRYVDRQLGWFYDGLEARGLLESILLIVTSDHRAMTPLRAEELGEFGEEARALIPLVVSDPNRPGARGISQRFQQVDLATSFRAMLTGSSCPTMVRGDLLNPTPAPPDCVFHARADDRGLVDVRCGQQAAGIRLQGDETDVEWGSLDEADQIIGQVNLERLRRQGVRRGGRRPRG
jgi:phosphoglycerol transferase MdoB-like AlkP superfamily enzyme